MYISLLSEFVYGSILIEHGSNIVITLLILSADLTREAIVKAADVTREAMVLQAERTIEAIVLPAYPTKQPIVVIE